MKKTKLNRFENKTALEPSPEQIKQAQQTFVDLLTPIVQKFQKSNPAPVLESFEELARQAKFGVKRSADFTKIISGAAEKPILVPNSNTLHNSGGAENSGEKIVTILNAEDLAILETLK